MGMQDSASQFSEVNTDGEIWQTLTGKDRLCSAPFNFYSSLAFSKLLESLDLPKISNSSVDITDEDIEFCELDEELIHALDHHSLITSQLPDVAEDHLQTADEIIEEIDRIMVGEDVPISGNEELDLVLCDPQAAAEVRTLYASKSLAGKFNFSGSCYFKLGMTIVELNALVDELDLCIRHYSSCLVRELAIRDELEYEQDIKDLFFTRLHEVQTRMDEWTARYADQDFEAGEKINEIDEVNDQEKSWGIFRGAASAAAAKELLANAALAVRRRWRRMGQSLEKARSSWHHHTRSRRLNNRRLTADVESLMVEREDRFNHHRHTQPISVTEKMCVSNSNVEFVSNSDGEAECGSMRTEDEDEWSVKSETNSVSTTPTNSNAGGVPVSNSTTAGIYHSPRRHQIWFTSTTAGAGKGKRNPQDDLRFLRTKIPYHRSSPPSYGPTVGHLELFNEFLLCMLTNNPNLTPLLTDYILNVYAPSERTVLPKLAI
nr:fasciculation and elongation protein zeta [Hymenolepis microstoma]